MLKKLTFALSILLCACTKPDYRLAEGQAGYFKEWQGKWVIINYWATWCEPCYEEIPEFNAFYKAHSEVVVLGVNFDRVQDEVLKNDITKMKIEFPVMTQDPSSALGFEQPSVLPVTAVFNPQGEIHKILIGPQTQKTLQKAMEVK
jgi:thiol-disulfide isomerase/thioredoxin